MLAQGGCLAHAVVAVLAPERRNGVAGDVPRPDRRVEVDAPTSPPQPEGELLVLGRPLEVDLVVAADLEHDAPVERAEVDGLHIGGLGGVVEPSRPDPEPATRSPPRRPDRRRSRRRAPSGRRPSPLPSARGRRANRRRSRARTACGRRPGPRGRSGPRPVRGSSRPRRSPRVVARAAPARPTASTMSRVPSVEPPSTTRISSISQPCWRTSDSRQSRMNPRSLSVGKITETLRGRMAAGAHRPCSERVGCHVAGLARGHD